MRHLRRLSVLLTVIGIVATVAGLAGVVPPTVTIGGVLLAWAGVVKIVALEIWRRVLNQPPERSL